MIVGEAFMAISVEFNYGFVLCYVSIF